MRVLIVDDVEDIRQVHTSFLRHLGHEVFSAGDGQQAIQYARELRPDVVFMDISMPGMDGWEVAHELRHDPATSEIRLVAISALSGPEFESRSRAAGFNAHFAKPISAEGWREIFNGLTDSSP